MEYVLIFGLIIVGFLLIFVEWMTREAQIYELEKKIYKLGSKLDYFYQNEHDWIKRK